MLRPFHTCIYVYQVPLFAWLLDLCTWYPGTSTGTYVLLYYSVLRSFMTIHFLASQKESLLYTVYTGTQHQCTDRYAAPVPGTWYSSTLVPGRPAAAK